MPHLCLQQAAQFVPRASLTLATPFPDGGGHIPPPPSARHCRELQRKARVKRLRGKMTPAQRKAVRKLMKARQRARRDQ